MTPLASPTPVVTPAEPAQDVFRAAQALVDSAVPGLADLAAVEIAESALCGGPVTTGGPVGPRAAFRRAAFRSVPAARARAAYAVGEVSRVPSRSPYLKSIRDLRPRLVREFGPQAAWLSRDPARAPLIAETGMHSMIVLPLVGEDAVLGLVALYRRAGSPSFTEDDLRAAAELVGPPVRCLARIRRRCQEESLGRELQHSLLPGDLPEVSAVEAAHGQVSPDGSTGAWYDAVPLPGARVALTVGVANGRGLAAAARMGRLRTVIRALASLDMDPSELLARADSAAADRPHPESDGDCPPSTPPEAGDHCLYLLYDPATGHCTVSRAGAASLLAVAPDGTVSAPAVADHPALGLSDQPFETTEFDVAPGTTLLLSSHPPGPAEAEPASPRLQEPRGRTDGAAPEEPLARLIPDGSPARLVARTRGLAPDNVASLPIPHDPAAVVDARAWTRRQLAAWTLDDLDYTTTLVVSELVTNAIRYSTGPVELRLIRDHALICEVSDNSSAAPHPRHPQVSDQEGRGLCIVTQLTRSVGTRYTPTGKIVWTEQAL